MPESVDFERVKRDGWQEDRILVISPDHPGLDWSERQAVINIGNRLYGKRVGNGTQK